jgi:hypothetical protein
MVVADGASTPLGRLKYLDRTLDTVSVMVLESNGYRVRE